MSHREPNGLSGIRAPASDGPLDLTLLRTFLAVHRAGSFTAAARLLGLSQPTVTTQIRSLEGQLGRELFERLPRGVAPTPVADDLAAQIAAPLDALAAVAARGHIGEETSAGPVHLAGPAELLCVRALPALAPLVEQGYGSGSAPVSPTNCSTACASAITTWSSPPCARAAALSPPYH